MNSALTTDARTGNLTIRIADQLGRSIVAGEYSDRILPIEAELAEQFAASRSVTREAVKMLTAKGLIASRPRHGTSVAPESSWNFLDPDVLRWLLGRDLSPDLLAEFTSFRTAIESHAAVLAINRNDPVGMRQIALAVERMEELRDADREATLAADINFHVAILLASGNRFMIACRGLVETALRFSIRLTDEEKGVPAAEIDAHRAIADAILARDAGGAVRATLELLNEAAMLIERARRGAVCE